MSEAFPVIVKTFFGLEQVLAAELTAIGAKNIQHITRGVQCELTTEQLYKANLSCRTALRILKPIKSFRASDQHELYRNVVKVEWEKIFSVDKTFSVDGVIHESSISHSHFLALKTKDSIADLFRQKFGKRPDVDKENADVVIHVHLNNDECTVSLDSSGEPLYKRGYRINTHEAQMNECLAAGLILLSGYNGSTHFIDFMCGSGTLLIEAALIAKNISPGVFRKRFAFQNWMDYDEPLWNKVVNDAEEEEIDKIPETISGCDLSGRAAGIAQKNCINAGVAKQVKITSSPFEEFILPKGKCIGIINPPYGERMNPGKLNGLYKHIGDYLKKNLAGSAVWILSSNMEAIKHIGLKPSKKIKVFNGPLECRFLCFDMYEGSRKKVKE